MIGLSAKIKVNTRIPTWAKQMRQEREDKMMESGEVILTNMESLMLSPKSGKIGRIPGTNQTYIMSAPGEAPAVVTRELIDSYSIQLRGTRIIIGSDLDKALELEKGTSRIAPRPHLEPATRNSIPQIRAIFGHSKWKINL